MKPARIAKIFDPEKPIGSYQNLQTLSVPGLPIGTYSIPTPG